MIRKILSAPYYRIRHALAAWTWRIRNRITGHPGRPEAPPNTTTLEFLATTGCKNIAEIGVEWGSTSKEIAKWLEGKGVLHLFDYEDRVKLVAERLRQAGFTNIVGHGNSRRTLDSYNWSLMEILRDGNVPAFDYVFLDGAHTWPIDALAFFLIDRLLAPGGYLDFDDYDWTIDSSPTVNPRVYPPMRRLYTEEQMRSQQVALVVNLLVRKGGNYEELVPNKIFRKRS
jgi:predicted O-methyltransferase YrrM